MNITTPVNKLIKNLSLLKSQSPDKQPVVLVSTGSMNPIHNQHVNVFETAKREIEAQEPNKKVVGGYISPLPDSEYMKKKLGSEAVKSKHRVEMVKLALEDSNWLDFDLWQTEYKKAFPHDITGSNDIITNLSNYLNLKYKPLTKEVRKNFPNGVEIVFICGSDDAEKFIENRYTGKSGMISRGFKTVVIGRGRGDWKSRLKKALDDKIGINKWDDFFLFVDGSDSDETSSTKIRNVIKGKEKDDLTKLLNYKVLNYIKEHKLYSGEEEKDDSIHTIHTQREREREKLYSFVVNVGRSNFFAVDNSCNSTVLQKG